MKIMMYADGGSRGNPGPAGCGATLLDESGKELATISEFIGDATNNQAEYQAVILGLRKALLLGATSISVRLDSQLIVKQVLGEYKVKHANMKPLFAEVKLLLREFDEYDIEHVRREQNVRADELVNEAIDSGV
jgi:ribonuclease HI